jgi:hypothetical protein
MRWHKFGRIYKPGPKGPFILSHASNATAIHLKDDVFRVFYNGRDELNRSSVSYFDFDMKLLKVTSDFSKCSLQFGHGNSYYSHGISLGSSFQEGKTTSLFFMGWQVPNDEHWRGEIGRIKLSSHLDRAVVDEYPFLSFDDNYDKISLSYPFIIKQEGTYRMWYGSTHSWTSSNGEMIHAIHYAESEDGKNWKRLGPAFKYEIGVAQAFSRPVIHINSQGYHMWFSYRSGTGKTYRIGYAFSKDGFNWIPDYSSDQIDVSAEGWDSEMICYPFVVSFNQELFMFYNGNGYGKTGIGLAKMIW